MEPHPAGAWELLCCFVYLPAIGHFPFLPVVFRGYRFNSETLTIPVSGKPFFIHNCVSGFHQDVHCRHGATGGLAASAFPVDLPGHP